MKWLLALVAALFTSISLQAADGGTTPYSATMSGMVCSACKAHVTDALKKLPGVENVSITRGDKEDTQKVTFTSTSATLTKEDAVKVLADQEQYKVLSLDKANP